MDRHVALVEVLRISAHHERRRFSKGSPGLLEWLVEAYASGRRTLDAAAVALEDGTVKAVSTTELASLLEQRPRYVALRLVGPGVADFLANETGCQIRRSLAAGPEIVRVRVEPGHHDPLARALAHAERVRAFEAGLEGTGTIVENPEALLPVTRVFHFDPAPDESAVARVEDYRFAYVASRRVRQLRSLLDDVWLLAAGRDVSSAIWNLDGGPE
jgi:hypothetical protein